MPDYKILSSTEYPNYSDLSLAYEAYVAALNGITNIYSPLLQERAKLIAAKNISVKEFSNYDPNNYDFSPNVVTEAGLKKLRDFRALLRILTEFPAWRLLKGLVTLDCVNFLLKFIHYNGTNYSRH